jgi:hypothetical protein
LWLLLCRSQSLHHEPEMMRVRHWCLLRIRERPKAASKAGPGCKCRAPSPCRRSGTLRASIASLCTGYIGGTPVESRCQVRIVCMLMIRHLMRSRPRIVHTPSMRHRGSISRQCMVYTALLTPASCRCTARQAFCRERRRTYSWRTSGIMCMCYLYKYSMSVSVQTCKCCFTCVRIHRCAFVLLCMRNENMLTVTLSLCTCVCFMQADSECTCVPHMQIASAHVCLICR